MRPGVDTVTAVLTDLPGELPEITIPAGIVGFPGAHRFALVSVSDDVPCFVLRSLDDENAQFVVVPPTVYFPEYAPSLDDGTATSLGLEDAEDALLLSVVTLGERAEETTANLFAPIVVNARTRTAAQVLLTGSPYQLRERLPLS